MILVVDGVQVSFPAKLDSRKQEIETFAKEFDLARIKRKSRMIKVWETKRYDLAAVIVKT